MNTAVLTLPQMAAFSDGIVPVARHSGCRERRARREASEKRGSREEREEVVEGSAGGWEQRGERGIAGVQHCAGGAPI